MLHAGVAANGVDRTLEYSRPVRSLKLWLAFRHLRGGHDAPLDRDDRRARPHPGTGALTPALSAAQRPAACRSSASATLMATRRAHLDVHNLRLAREIARTAASTSRRLGRRHDLPARLLHELPHRRRAGRRAPARDRGACSLAQLSEKRPIAKAGQARHRSRCNGGFCSRRAGSTACGWVGALT